MLLETKGALLGLAAGLGVLGITFGLTPLFQPNEPAKQERDQSLNSGSPVAMIAPTGTADVGHNLFDRNCTHCHGADARGDEGPSLYNLRKSDARVSAIIKGGIKGEMPAFAKKFSEADVQALIFYLRSLKD